MARRSWRLCGVLWLCGLAVALPACRRAERPVSSESTSGVASLKSSAEDVLFASVVETLGRLDARIDTQLRPPTVVLDASKSSDGRDVLGTIGRDAASSSGPFDTLEVQADNSRFRRIGVRPGDQVRLFISDPVLQAQVTVLTSAKFQQHLRERPEIDEQLVSTWIEEELQSAGPGGKRFIELAVRRVDGESTLRLVPPLPIEIPSPERFEIWRFADAKLKNIMQRLKSYQSGLGARIGWEPTPDEAVLEQIVERLNQWFRQQPADDAWQPDPLVGTLPEELRALVPAASLTQNRFEAYDGRLLQEAVWLRDISKWARGDSIDDVARAKALFDWTVRNIQLEAEPAPARSPWQALIGGRATALERAWIFALLARQQGLGVVVLARKSSSDGAWSDWVAALWSGGQFYLFDPRLGLPLPGKESGSIATLEQVAADDSLLRQLDGDEPYPVRAEQLERVAVRIVASPEDLSRRMQAVQSRLAGDRSLAVSLRPSKLAEALSGAPRVGEVGIWELPFRTRLAQQSIGDATRRQWAEQIETFAWQPLLWKARVLHFQGRFGGEGGAKEFYRQARPADQQLAQFEQASPEVVAVLRRAKLNASYWLGLMMYDEGQPEVSLDYLRNRCGKSPEKGPWAGGILYNTGRALERMGRMDEARELYNSDRSPQQLGNHLRARWLDRPDAAAAPDEAKTPVDSRERESPVGQD